MQLRRKRQLMLCSHLSLNTAMHCVWIFPWRCHKNCNWSRMLHPVCWRANVESILQHLFYKSYTGCQLCSMLNSRWWLLPIKPYKAWDCLHLVFSAWPLRGPSLSAASHWGQMGGDLEQGLLSGVTQVVQFPPQRARLAGAGRPSVFLISF